MFVCCPKFLRFLRQGTDSQDIWNKILQRVEGDEIRLLQISDLHLQAPTDRAGFAGAADQFASRVKEKLKDWRERFRSDTEINLHGLVVSGDL
jgi:hypothetical protein